MDRNKGAERRYDLSALTMVRRRRMTNHFAEKQVGASHHPSVASSPPTFSLLADVYDVSSSIGRRTCVSSGAHHGAAVFDTKTELADLSRDMSTVQKVDYNFQDWEVVGAQHFASDSFRFQSRFDAFDNQHIQRVGAKVSELSETSLQLTN